MKDCRHYLSLPDSILSHSHLYAALSRVQNPRGLKIMVCGGKISVGSQVLVKNVVYREIFQTQMEKPLSLCIDLTSTELENILNRIREYPLNVYP